MSKIKDFFVEWRPRDLCEYTLFASAIALVACFGLYSYCLLSLQKNPNPPIYRDVNGDGVKDKIVQRKVRKQGFLWRKYITLEDEVWFGIEVKNGEKLYLPKDLFEEYHR